MNDHSQKDPQAMTTIKLTTAQAMMRWLSVQKTEDGDRFIDGVWAIFGHGNVAGIGEALHGIGDALPTWRGQNEQTMCHAAIAYAKTKRRRRAMAVTSSIGPGATNMVTAAALAHVNRLPLLLIPGDVFANRRPDPVLQQIEDFEDGTVSANDCFKPVSRYFDRISRPEHLLTCLPRAMATLTDPQNCGPVTLAFCQDVQAEDYDFPVAFFQPRTWRIRRPERQGRAGGIASAELRLAGCHGLCLRQRNLRRCRPGDRRRHPLSGFHDSILDRFPQSRSQARVDQPAPL